MNTHQKAQGEYIEFVTTKIGSNLTAEWDQFGGYWIIYLEDNYAILIGLEEIELLENYGEDDAESLKVMPANNETIAGFIFAAENNL